MPGRNRGSRSILAELNSAIFLIFLLYFNIIPIFLANLFSITQPSVSLIVKQMKEKQN